jgi:hypothetical protein
LVNFFPWLDAFPGDFFHVKKLLNNVDKLNHFIHTQTQEHYAQHQAHRRTANGVSHRRRQANGLSVGAKGKEEHEGGWGRQEEEEEREGRRADEEASAPSDYIFAYLKAMDKKRESGVETSLNGNRGNLCVAVM